MNILVLGGGGFIGSHLCDALLSAGHQVCIFEYPGVKSMCTAETMQHIEWVEGDFTNPVQLDNAISGCDIIYHLISTTLPKTSNENPVYDAETNLISTIQLLQSACKHKVKKIIFVSSGGTVYGIPQQIPITEEHPTNPISSYGISKLSIEKYLHLFYTLHDLDYLVLRLANPYGERQRTHASQGAIAVFLDKALHGETIEVWGNGEVVRDYIYISDVIAALILAIEHNGNERLFNIGMGLGLSINQVLATIEKVCGLVVSRRYLVARSFDVPSNILDIDKAKQYLHWQPRVNFEQGLGRFANWLRHQNV